MPALLTPTAALSLALPRSSDSPAYPLLKIGCTRETAACGDDVNLGVAEADLQDSWVKALMVVLDADMAVLKLYV